MAKWHPRFSDGGLPCFRGELGDETGRFIIHDHGWLEYRYGPGSTCEIVNIEVDEVERGKGKGRALLEALYQHLKGKAKRLYVFTRTTNRPAHEFYERVGFTRGADFIPFYPEGEAVLFVRDVPA